MYTVWTNHLKTDKEKEIFRNQVLNAREVLRRLSALIEQELKDLDISELNTKIYDAPNWSHKIAHGNGFKSASRFIQKLINLDQKETN